MKWWMIGIWIIAVSCREKIPVANDQVSIIQRPTDTLLISDTSLSVHNGIMYQHQKPFLGYVVNFDEAGNRAALFAYAAGREEGWQLRWFSNGQQESTRYYHLGEKDSVHTGWWADGHKRFEYHFKQGRYHGLFSEWYSNGAPFRQVMYNNGAEQWAKGWRDNGKLYMNYVVRNGRRFGIFNAVLCYALKNERGEFDSSTKKSPAVETVGRF